MSPNGQLKIAAVWIALLAAQSALASPLSAQNALERVHSWAGRRNVRAGRIVARPSGKVKTIAEGGTDLFHLVAIDGGGFVAVAADDSRPPVMAFSPSGDLPDESDGSPFWALLGADGAAAAGLPSPRRHGDRRKMKSKTATFPRGDSRKASSATIAVSAAAAHAAVLSSLASVADVRVAPLVASKWDQKKAGGKYCYNYYTPCHWYCGCTATAMAQLMRFHRYPSESVASQSFTCRSNDTSVVLSMIAGVYDWDSMPLVPDSSMGDYECEMIGRICYDAGVAMRTQYSSSGSAALGGFAHGPLKDVFGYANAESYINNNSIGETEIKKAILANLDAGFPVLLGIIAPDSSGRDAGHAIVADGYGYEDGELWCHLNMGWSGSCDLWYALPNIPAGGYAFTIVDDVVYNIFPHGSGQLVTGRVTDEDGNALSNATVSASYTTRSGWLTKTITTNVTTSASGIYSFLIPMSSSVGSRTVRLTAAYGAGATASYATTTVSASSSPYDMNFETGACKCSSSGLSVGNSWGNDLVVVAAAGAEAEISKFSISDYSAGNEGFSLSFNGTAGAKYAVEWTDALTNATWNVWTNVLLGTEGALSVFLPIDAGSAQSSRFYRVRPE